MESLERQVELETLAERSPATVSGPKWRRKQSRSSSKVARAAKRAAERSSSRGREASLPVELRMTTAQAQLKQAPRKDSSRQGAGEATGGAETAGPEMSERSPLEKREKLFDALGMTGSGGSVEASSEVCRQVPDRREDVEHVEDISSVRDWAAPSTEPDLHNQRSSAQEGSTPGKPPVVPPRPAGRRGHRRSDATELRNLPDTRSSEPENTLPSAPILKLPQAIHSVPSANAGDSSRRGKAGGSTDTRREASRKDASGGSNDGDRESERA